MLGYEYLKTKTPRPPLFDVIVVRLKPANEVMEDFRQGWMFNLVSTKGLRCCGDETCMWSQRGQRKQCRGLNFLSKGKGEALAGQGILFTNVTLWSKKMQMGVKRERDGVGEYKSVSLSMWPLYILSLIFPHVIFYLFIIIFYTKWWPANIQWSVQNLWIINKSFWD